MYLCISRCVCSGGIHAHLVREVENQRREMGCAEERNRESDDGGGKFWRSGSVMMVSIYGGSDLVLFLNSVRVWLLRLG